jgi:hypothetical protein
MHIIYLKYKKLIRNRLILMNNRQFVKDGKMNRGKFWAKKFDLILLKPYVDLN